MPRETELGSGDTAPEEEMIGARPGDWARKVDEQGQEYFELKEVATKELSEETDPSIAKEKLLAFLDQVIAHGEKVGDAPDVLQWVKEERARMEEALPEEILKVWNVEVRKINAKLSRGESVIDIEDARSIDELISILKTKKEVKGKNTEKIIKGIESIKGGIDRLIEKNISEDKIRELVNDKWMSLFTRTEGLRLTVARLINEYIDSKLEE